MSVNANNSKQVLLFWNFICLNTSSEYLMAQIRGGLERGLRLNNEYICYSVHIHTRIKAGLKKGPGQYPYWKK